MSKATSANALRNMFIEYFKERGHEHVASSPIVPPDDPTMLFTSAGMVQFKPLYAGQVDPLPYTRATTVQKCLRAGGKGSDLENVG
ncbi:MAG: alanine--tRNA ligase-related protein, partial [Candidatus Sumerlaeota bacterium]